MKSKINLAPSMPQMVSPIGTTTLVNSSNNNGTVIYNDDETVLIAAIGFTTLVVKPGCLEISDYAFRESPNIKEVRLPASIKIIGKHAFENREKLKKINLENVKMIGSCAFKNCSGLTNINAKNAETIWNGAFEGCEKLKTIILSKKLKYHRINVFKNCMSLKHLYFDEKGSTKANNNVTRIAREAFLNCTILNYKTLPKNISYIGQRAFFGCNKVNINMINKYTPIKILVYYNNVFKKNGKIMQIIKYRIFKAIKKHKIIPVK